MYKKIIETQIESYFSLKNHKLKPINLKNVSNYISTKILFKI